MIRRCALLAVLAFALLPVVAADHDAAYYQRTGTHPDAPKGDFLLPITGFYADKIGVGGGLGYRFHESGIILMGQITYTRIDGVNGTVPYATGCETFIVPYSVPSRSQAGFAFTFVVPIERRR